MRYSRVQGHESETRTAAHAHTPEDEDETATHLAKPKSHTFSVQSAFNSTFEGFKSRWMTSAECMYFNAHRIW